MSETKGIYFSYHQERDGDRAEVVMSHSATQDFDVPSIWNQREWDEAMAAGDVEIEDRIAEALRDVKLTCLLIGERTVDKPWIRPVLRMSHELGKGIFAVYIHNIPDYNGKVTKKGPNPMGNLKYTGRNSKEYPFASYYFTYDWRLHDGPERFNKWAEIAAHQIGEEA